MKFFAFLLLLPAPLPAEVLFQNETLQYSLNYPNGLSLGDGQMRSTLADGRRRFEFRLDAGLPGVPVHDEYLSVATEAICGLEFTHRSVHGARKREEKTVFDSAAGVARRTTLGGGGTSTIPAPSCPHDALSFLYFLRRELAQGRVPAGSQTVFLGAAYQLSLDYGGTQRIPIAEENQEADRIRIRLKGPASETAFDLFFARDAARTLLQARFQLPAGALWLELVR